MSKELSKIESDSPYQYHEPCRESIFNDGYTEHAYIRPVERLHSEVRFTYRPSLAEERAIFIRQTQKEMAPDKVERLLAQQLAKKIKWWSLTQPIVKSDNADDLSSGNNREPIPIQPQFITRLRPPIIQRLASIVIYGDDGGDIDPLWTKEEIEEHDETLEFSAVSGKSFADSKQDLQEKN